MGADPGAVLRGARSHAECRARAIVVHVACDGAGVPVVGVAGLLGVSAAAVSAGRRRGARLPAELVWTMDDLVAWSVRPEQTPSDARTAASASGAAVRDARREDYEK